MPPAATDLRQQIAAALGAFGAQQVVSRENYLGAPESSKRLARGSEPETRPPSK